MKILSIDSSTEACSVSLFDSDYPQQLQELYELAPREHSQRLLPMVDQLLADSEVSLSQLEAIAFGCGPGSFTGLRICLGLVQGLAFGADLPVVAVSSLAAQAQAAIDRGLLQLGQSAISSIDARMNELYWGHYCNCEGLAELQGEEQLTAPEQLILPQNMRPEAAMVAVGNGWQYADRIAEQQIKETYADILPRASAISLLAARDYRAGRYCSADRAAPVYIRDQVAWKKLSEQ